MPLTLRRFAPSRGAAGIFRAMATLTVVGLIVASCGGGKKPGVCPRIATLAQAGELTQFSTGNTIAMKAEITDVRVECEYETGDQVRMSADISTRIRVTKGPGMQGETAKFSYFVTVTDRRGNVLNKRVFPVTVNFRGRQSFTFDDGSWQYYRLTRGGTGRSYEIWIGFQLNESQLEYNRRKGIE